ncbi:MAG: SRPBCC domain-containing protein [Natronomonas sp.]|uniref:SRPBCC domain-containing protein n=1 Tax=Natronomonas sp. TaxID=2184060 RepID=UPI00286FB591|nr:SRPBCC domain-containing protein [Natronomonas sp.]MDR9380773.1 SRPBCC domain-containing protein [Natronomonas sp.]MDR9430214.1 SRPBCC domain-containing protein [Natronomonas sp.]
MKTVEHEIHIAASPETVWNILTDLESYADWNPFIPNAEGTIERDARLRVRVEPPGNRSMTLKPRVKIVEPNGRLVWLGRLFVPNLFDGRHEFIIEPAVDGVRFLQRETFAGVLVPIALDVESVERGFEEMNEALKRQAETVA